MTRAIDALIAEHVFEIIMPPNSEYIRNYSTSIADAWLVVEKMGCIATSENTWDLFNIIKTPEGFDASFGHFSVEVEDAPLAICLAALKSLGLEVPDE